MEPVIDERDYLARIVSDLVHEGASVSPRELSEAFRNELFAEIEPSQLTECSDFESLLTLIRSKILRDRFDLTISDYFGILEGVAKDELHTSICLRWFSNWSEYFKAGNFLTSPEPYDLYEMSLRISEEMGINMEGTALSSADSSGVVGDTVKHIWLQRHSVTNRK